MSVVRKIVGVLVPLALFGTLLTWSLASPVGASPDEDYHLASIWCGQGDRTDICEPGRSASVRQVPARLTQSADCYAFRSEASARCDLPDDSVLRPTSRGNFVGDYPPVYYWTLGLFAGPDVAASVIAMRAFNALLYVGLLSGLFLLLPRGKRSPLVWTAAATVVPLGMFLIPSVNPSSWSIISAGTLIPALLGFTTVRTRGRRIGLLAIAAVALVIGSGARSDSAAYSVLAVVIALLLTVRRDRTSAILAIVGAILAAVAVIFFRASGQSGVVDPVSDAQNPQADPAALLFTNLTELPALWAGASGTWGLGWLDTLLPGAVWVSVLAVYSALVFAGLKTVGWRRAVSLALILAALVLVPTYVLSNEQIFVGAGVQPRYVYPLLVMLAFVSLMGAGVARVGMSRVQTGVVIALLGLANCIALHANIRRYVVGTDVKGVNLNIGLEWWWNLPVGPNVVWVAGSLAFVLALAGIALVLDRTAREGVLGAASGGSEGPLGATTPGPLGRVAP